MSAAEDDTELRDLLVQNLENSGVLNKLKAEMRAAVFLAMEDQDRLENKAPLVNQNLRRCLDTREGRLVASLIVDFLQVFNLDFSLSVFQPEINWDPDVDRARQPPEDRTGPPAVSKDSDSVSKAEQAPPRAGGGLDLDLEGDQDQDQDQDLDQDQDQDLDLDQDQDPDEGDSFFDDPLPKPQKTYGGSLTGEQDSDRTSSRLDPGAKGGPSGSRPDSQRPGAGTSPPEPSRTGASRGVRGHSDRSASLHLDDDVEYDDDFNSHRSDLSKSELSIGEEIEEVSIEGPDASEKLDDTTQDLSVSRLSPAADYMEDVS
ncbi:centrosomal protein 43 isoform 3-T3 [Menidia menidia]